MSPHPRQSSHDLERYLRSEPNGVTSAIYRYMMRTTFDDPWTRWDRLVYKITHRESRKIRRRRAAYLAHITGGRVVYESATPEDLDAQPGDCTP